MKRDFKIEFHSLYYFVAFLCVITGYFKDFIWVSLLILVHELGHVTGAYLRHWRIQKVLIMPFGGMTILKEKRNRPIGEEFFILCMGPLYQILLFFLLQLFDIINPIFTGYHYALLCFNLLPIYPLDGFQIVELFLEKICSYAFAKRIGSIFSIIVLLLITVYGMCSKQLLFMLILLFLWIHQYRYRREIPYIVSQFYYDTYQYPISFRHYQYIRGIHLNKMKRGSRHLFYENNHWCSEDTILRNYWLRTIDKNGFL